jgi:multicomponent Na+:H+ antiporter subunit C
MELLLALVVGVLFGCGCYLLIQRTLGHVIIGLALITNSMNLLIFTAARVSREGPALIGTDGALPPEGHADPLPQALILTAIVIGFGVLAFFIALAYRTYRSVGTDDLSQLNTTDRLDAKTEYEEAP